MKPQQQLLSPEKKKGGDLRRGKPQKRLKLLVFNVCSNIIFHIRGAIQPSIPSLFKVPCQAI